MSAPPDLHRPSRDAAPWPSLAADSTKERGPTREVFLEVATSIAGKLCRDAIWDDSPRDSGPHLGGPHLRGPHCAWLGEGFGNANGRMVDAVLVFGPDLYLGSGGISLFLAHLATLVDDRILRRTALGGLRRTLATVELVPPKSRLSLYIGWTGIALAVLNAAELLGEESLRKPALALLDDLESWERDDWDVLNGIAGAIPALLTIHQRFNGPDRLVDQAVSVGDHLIATGHASDNGLSWGDFANGTNEERAEKGGAFGNLTGLSHGAGGVGWVLTELFDVTGEVRFREAAQEAFRYERNLFNAEEQNWPDLRDPQLFARPSEDGAEPQPTFMTAWCHGAAGIALTRLRAWEILGDETFREEAEIAIATTRKSFDQPGNYCLCHGHTGNCDPLLEGARVLKRPELRQAAEDVGWRGYDEVADMMLPWPCGSRSSNETPGLFLGLAGIGYAYLRLADPESFPSLLLPTWSK